MYITTASTTVKFHEFPSGNLVHNYQPGTKVDGPIRSISWSRDSKWLAVVPHSGFTEIVSVKDQINIIRPIQEIGEPSCASFPTSTNKCIALGTKSGQVLIYDIKTHSTKKRFPRASSMITHVAYAAKDSYCVAACSNGDIHMYNNTTNSLVYTFKVPKSNNVTALRTHVLKRNLIMGGSTEGTVVVWDANVGKNKFCIDAHNGTVTSVAFSPVNTMLVLTAGLDRQFRIFDIDSKTCIASVPVENSCTALDFTDDATHFALASQNGKVYIYDSRRVTEPVHSFEAHNSGIKHLAFQSQKKDMGNNSSFCSIPEEIQPGKSDEDTTRRTSELFAQVIHSSSMSDVPDKSPDLKDPSVEGGDSFIAALGITNHGTFTFDSSKPDESCNALQLDKKSRYSTGCTPNQIKSLHEKFGLHGPKTSGTTSTPLINIQQNLENVFSPIVALGGKPSINFASGDIQGTLRDIVKSELKHLDIKDDIKSTLDDMKSALLFQSKHTLHETRRMMLDLQISMVREFMKMEDTIREELSSGIMNLDENYLLEENANLKQRIVFLEQKILHLENEVAVMKDQSHIQQNGI